MRSSLPAIGFGFGFGFGFGLGLGLGLGFLRVRVRAVCSLWSMILIDAQLITYDGVLDDRLPLNDA